MFTIELYYDKSVKVDVPETGAELPDIVRKHFTKWEMPMRYTHDESNTGQPVGVRNEKVCSDRQTGSLPGTVPVSVKNDQQNGADEYVGI